MSTIKFYFLILILFTFSCTKKSDFEKHGMSKISTSEFGYRGPVSRVIRLKFNVQKDEVTTITALVAIPYKSSVSHNYEWRLGEGVSLEQGSLKGSILFDKENEFQKIKISVKGFNLKNTQRFVKFEIFGENQSRITFADGLVSSDQENSFEEIVKEVENYKKENSP